MDYALLITALVPVLIGGTKKFLPGLMGKIPTFLIPIAAPLLGIGLDYLGSFATGTSAGTLKAAIYGGLGVWLREVVDQFKTAAVGKPA